MGIEVVLILLVVVLIIAYICFYKQINIFIVGITGQKRVQKHLYKSCKLNDYLILNDLYIPIDKDKFKHIDTLIFGNKYIYVTTIIKQVGDVIISLDDKKWRVIYNGHLTLIDNEFIHNQRVINHLINLVEGIEEKDLKSLVVFTKTCNFEKVKCNENEYLAIEKEVMSLINQIEAESNEDIFDPNEMERYCGFFYKNGIKSERRIKKAQKNRR